MRGDVNLLVTYDPENQFAARSEVRQVLREVGEENPEFVYSNVHGLFKIRVNMEPEEATEKLDALCRKDPSTFWYTYHWIPIEKWCPSTIGEMSKVVKEFAERIGMEERWRMRINKRFYEGHHTRELIEELAQHVNRPNVDLENPDKTIRIEIIREEAALSLLKPREHFSVNEAKDEVLTVEQ